MKKEQENRRKQEERLAGWQRRLAQSKARYEGQLALMDQREAIYNGTSVVDAPEGGGAAQRRTSNVYNVAYELIEGQVDSSLPMPRVRASCEGDEVLAARVEDMLRAKMERLAFEEMNDMDERNTYNQGGDFALVEWDNRLGTHTAVGDLAVRILHPRQVIPQDGMVELEDMDYFFVRASVSKEVVKRRYGVDVGGAHSTLHEGAVENAQGLRGGMPSEELVGLNTAYYKNERGGIGRYIWAGDCELEALEEYQARRLWRCVACGEVAEKQEKGGCVQCGGRLRWQEEEYEQLAQPVYRSDGSAILPESPVLDEGGQPVLQPVLGADGRVQLDVFGNAVMMPLMRPTRIPYYKPGVYPVVLRRNVSKYGSFLGGSDIDVIRPQQDAIKKLMGSMMEKLLKGGSYVTLPAGVKIETSDRQLKVLRIDSPAQKALIDVLNVQPNINFDMAALEDQYEKARSALGITNSFQGKPDATAVSGTAKQFAAAQTAGRLESKRRMKQAFYEKLHRMMFRFMLAYADEPVRFAARDDKGNEGFAQFNRYDFLKMDDAGEYYWDDGFLFSVDASGGLAQNREAMWAEAEKKYAGGALGDPAATETRILYWNLLEQLQFPMAKGVRKSLHERAQRESAARGEAQQGWMEQQAGVMGEEGEGLNGERDGTG